MFLTSHVRAPAFATLVGIAALLTACSSDPPPPPGAQAPDPTFFVGRWADGAGNEFTATAGQGSTVRVEVRLYAAQPVTVDAEFDDGMLTLPQNIGQCDQRMTRVPNMNVIAYCNTTFEKAK